jgi:hypothetical protein
MTQERPTRLAVRKRHPFRSFRDLQKPYSSDRGGVVSVSGQATYGPNQVLSDGHVTGLKRRQSYPWPHPSTISHHELALMYTHIFLLMHIRITKQKKRKRREVQKKAGQRDRETEEGKKIHIIDHQHFNQTKAEEL